MNYIEEEEYYLMEEKRRKIDMFLDSFSNEQLDEVINIVRNIAVFNLHPDYITPEVQNNLHNGILKSVDIMENIEKIRKMG
ncbi:MAG: hypothetical protein K2G83_05790 [Ruminococcus sp.]|nr:hypothetical protein [Ruminococcus sp.]